MPNLLQIQVVVNFDISPAVASRVSGEVPRAAVGRQPAVGEAALLPFLQSGATTAQCLGTCTPPAGGRD